MKRGHRMEETTMPSPAKRFALIALAAVVVALPACSKDAPPAPMPEPTPEAPAPAPTPPPEPAQTGDWEEADVPEQTFLSAEEINQRRLLKPIYFDFDKADIRGDQRSTLQANADWLREHTDVAILIEGHCDERGTRQYNLALGDRRASATRDYLVALGIGANRVEIVSYGEERPAIMGEGEQNWSQNRRGEFVATSAGQTNE